MTNFSISVTPLINDGVMRAILEKLKEFIPLILDAAQSNSLIVRYHGDADGISGALAIKKALSQYYRAIYIQNNSPFYELTSALFDITLFPRSQKPTILLIDFGSNKESEEALQLLKANNFQILHIDHHPFTFDKNLPDLYVTPWLFGGESNYTAGMIAGELARLLGYAEASNFQKISLSGDKSTFLKEEWREEADKASLVLDFLAQNAEGKTRCIDVYEKALSNREMFNLIYAQANAEIEEILFKTKDIELKESKRGFKFAVINLSSMIENKKFPGRGAAAGIIFDKFKKIGPLVVVGYFEGVFSIRANDEAINIGFSANDEIEKIKNDLGDLILSGGGHKCASSLRTSKTNEQLVAKELSKRLSTA